MFDKPTSSHVIGLELDGPFLYAAQLSLQKGKPKISQLFEIPLDQQSTDVNPLYMSERGRQLQEATENCLVVTSLESDKVLIRPLEVKLKKEQDISAVLAFQAEPLLPYPIENALLDRIRIETVPDGTHLNVLAARKDHVQEHLNYWNTKNIEPEIISSAPFALALFSRHFCDCKNEPHFVVHIGWKETLCVLVKEGKLLAAQSSHYGFNDLKASSFDEEQVNLWRTEVTRILYGLGKSKKEEGTGILFTGEGASNELLKNSLRETFQKGDLGIKEEGSFSLNDLQKFAVAIGSAISGLPNQKMQINFRQAEFSYPYPWKRLKQPLLLYLTLCLALSFAIYVFGSAYYSYKEDNVRQEYVALLASMNKSYSSFEKEYGTKFPSNTDYESSINALTQTDISNRIQYLQKEMKDNPNLFPLLPNVPKVSDVLAWLSSHPIINASQQDSSLNGNSTFQIEHFSYVLVKRPDNKKPQEKYQVKVELEFTSATPKQAREFHDALIAPNDIVDPKGEVKWGSNRGKYRTSFFLKDKTVYP